MSASRRSYARREGPDVHAALVDAQAQAALLRERRPELDPAIRHLGVRAVQAAFAGTVVATPAQAASDLPDLAEYLGAKHPELPSSAVRELEAHLASLTAKPGEAPRQGATEVPR